MVQLVKCLPHKHENLSLEPPAAMFKKPGEVARTCEASIGKEETMDLWGSLGNNQCSCISE